MGGGNRQARRTSALFHATWIDRPVRSESENISKFDIRILMANHDRDHRRRRRRRQFPARRYGSDSKAFGRPYTVLCDTNGLYPRHRGTYSSSSSTRLYQYRYSIHQALLQLEPPCHDNLDIVLARNSRIIRLSRPLSAKARLWLS